MFSCEIMFMVIFLVFCLVLVEIFVGVKRNFMRLVFGLNLYFIIGYMVVFFFLLWVMIMESFLVKGISFFIM